MNKVWFTSDTHFGHKNIIRYCKRPFDSIESMNAELIKRWNAMVAPDDVVYHLGDFSTKLRAEDAQAVLSQLNGTKTLIYGNHDSHWSKTKWLRLGFDEVYDYLTVEIDGRKIGMVHDPALFVADSNFNLGLCGHVHTRWKTHIFGNLPIVNVGVDMWGYYPIDIQQILEYLT